MDRLNPKHLKYKKNPEFLHGVRASYCAAQNHRFSLLDPRRDVSTLRMYKNTLLETYHEDESALYAHGPLPAMALNKFRYMDIGLSDATKDAAKQHMFAYEYHHLCGNQALSCPLGSLYYSPEFDAETEAGMFESTNADGS